MGREIFQGYNALKTFQLTPAGIIPVRFLHIGGPSHTRPPSLWEMSIYLMTRTWGAGLQSMHEAVGKVACLMTSMICNPNSVVNCSHKSRTMVLVVWQGTIILKLINKDENP